MKKLLLFILLFLGFASSSVAQNEMEKPAPAFSPDGDGVMDTFTFDAANMKEMKVEIVNVGGVIVFKCDNAEHCGWDGIDLNGKPAPDGTYIYTQTALGMDDKAYTQSGKLILKRNK
jgi:gliding motility-associated-like protein